MADEKYFVGQATHERLEDLLARDANRPIDARPVKPGAGHDRYFIRSTGGGALIARLPASGIAAAKDSAIFGLPPGTLIPGKADCDICQILPGTSGLDEVVIVGRLQTVYNLRMVDLPGTINGYPQYIPIVKDGYGKWLAINWFGVVDVWCDDQGLHVNTISPGTHTGGGAGMAGGEAGFFSSSGGTGGGGGL